MLTSLSYVNAPIGWRSRDILHRWRWTSFSQTVRLLLRLLAKTYSYLIQLHSVGPQQVLKAFFKCRSPPTVNIFVEGTWPFLAMVVARGSVALGIFQRYSEYGSSGEIFDEHLLQRRSSYSVLRPIKYRLTRANWWTVDLSATPISPSTLGCLSHTKYTTFMSYIQPRRFTFNPGSPELN